ncbi:5-dehydro-4-deoxy-D-glucuronate isomerase [Cryobacterium adonitolivorans]|uniref:5-dehydro-4-deoxy-D-glucuronate isomerase n=1 Tax=Cryobacterium adonitolivorans TaxID=1259189 RepID=A0A4R8W217_9MICO|nr:5-dehydro-4-deoxy-D-glucuronate isomerase [Cryobacterium adonitolivorans]TFC01027.1 5-dehydro-4-deoxy-D-glucuronate isomerase [Cryobacterium adonitolivorans]
MISVRQTTGPDGLIGASTGDLRDKFLVQDLFVEGEFRGTYLADDRIVVAGVVPGDHDIEPSGLDVLGTDLLLERRELGVVNLAEPGDVIVDGTPYRLGPLDGLYVGRGSKVSFRGKGARFYLVSATAHETHPTVLIARDSVAPVSIVDELGAGGRTLYRYVWGGGHGSCQLQFGVTVLDLKSVWNTLPPHRHSRRTEVYLYTGLGPDHRVVHLLGEPNNTRHLIVAEEEVVIAPSWSLHMGAGTAPYSFVWAMAGENTDYTDLEPVKISDLR